jgi:flagellar biosynthesis/type III secretory pathway M-ring protein FliF/YscJ
VNHSRESQEKQRSDKKVKFQLLRYFSITSLVAFVLVAVSLVTFYRRVAVSDLIEIGESKNVAIAKTFSNVIWPEFAPFLKSISNLSADDIRTHPDTAQLRKAVLDQMHGLTIIKVKIYDLQGITIFSSQESQIGEDKSENAGFITAREGGIANELTHRDTFSAFESEIENRDVISSYIPILHGSSRVEGVLEIYDDVTPLLKNISIAQRNIAIGVALILTLLYAILFLFVRRADNLIKQQFIEQQHAEEKIKMAFNDLEIKKRKEERVNEFFRLTLEHMTETVNLGAEKAELLTYLEQIRRQFSDLD